MSPRLQLVFSMADYPSYNQANKADGYNKPVSEVGGRLRSPATDVKNDCRDQVLDLSGKPIGSSVAMVAGRQWTSEQDAALDLTSYGKQVRLRDLQCIHILCFYHFTMIGEITGCPVNLYHWSNSADDVLMTFFKKFPTKQD